MIVEKLTIHFHEAQSRDPKVMPTLTSSRNSDSSVIYMFHLLLAETPSMAKRYTPLGSLIPSYKVFSFSSFFYWSNFFELPIAADRISFLVWIFIELKI